MVQENSLQMDGMRRIKWLTQALLISGALNIGLMATFVYFVVQEKESALVFDLKPVEFSLPSTNQELLRAYSSLSFQELLLRLEEEELIEEGFSKRDLALSCLVAFHHFDIEKALGGSFFQKRKIAFSSQDGLDQMEIALFPGLNEAQYGAIQQFAKVEKWPFTSRGLFYEIERNKDHGDAALIATFYLTHEFEKIALLFSRASHPVDKEVLLQLLLEGDWHTIERFDEEQKKAQDLSSGRRVAFLLDYLHLRSKMAASLLLQTDLTFVCKRLDDPHILLLLDLLQEKSALIEKFIKVLLVSPRSDAVWKKASSKLFAFAGEAPIEPFNRELVLKRFIPQALPFLVGQKKAELVPKKAEPLPVIKAQPLPIQSIQKKKHVVQEGENLWKIARKYRVTIEAIMQLNHLESEKLRPGKELLIP